MVKIIATRFYREQGPWYTVEYLQATVIETAFGRAKLIACFEDPRLMMTTYNLAVAQLPTGGKRPSTWPQELIHRLTQG